MRFSSSLVLLCSLVTSDAFLVRPSSHPNLQKFAEAQLGKLLQIRLDIASKTKDAKDAVAQRLSFQGPLIKFMDAVKETASSAVAAMPVARTTPHLSSGTKSLDIVKNGFVIDAMGQRSIPFSGGSWEMTWKEGQSCGSIGCAFDLPEAVSRNQAVLPAGRVYVNFPVWTQEGLLEDQAYKRLMQNKIREYQAEKDRAIAKCQEATNPIAKALSYHQILQAMENIQNTPRCQHIPDDMERDVVKLESGLVLTKKGTVWSQPKNAFEKPTSLGYATVTLCNDEDSK